jgi:phosphotransferase family enzyme
VSLIERWAYHTAIIISADDDGALVHATSDGWRLPSNRSENTHPADVTPILAELRRHLDRQATVLRCVRTQPVQAADTVRRWYEVELHGGGRRLPNGWRWLPAAELSDQRWADPSDEVLVRECLTHRAKGDAVRVDGRAWEAAGWWDSATTWISGQLAKLGVTGEPSIQQIRCWEFSCVARVDTMQGTWYFKALPASYAHEPLLTRRLAERHPQLLPEVAAVQPEQRWLLTRACAGASLERRVDIQAWERAATRYAELQCGWLGGSDQLRSLGCHDRRIEHLADATATLLDHPDEMLPGSERLASDEIARLKDLVQQVPGRCQTLASFELPPTLDHGDLWPSNVLMEGAECRFIDWTDASISHPFVSLLPLKLGFCFDSRRERLPGGARRLRDAYLVPWSAAYRVDELQRAFELARPLAALTYALKVRELPSHAQWWLDRTVPMFLRVALREAAELDS